MDIQSIAERAKKTMLKLKGKEYVPEFLVEFTDGTKAAYILDRFPGGELDTTRMKMLYFEQLGKRCQREHHKKPVKELVFICETWGVHMKPDEQRDFRFPSQSDKAKEYLSIWHYRVSSGKHSLYHYEILNRETALDLLKSEMMDEGEGYRINNSLFPAFLAGFTGNRSAMGKMLNPKDTDKTNGAKPLGSTMTVLPGKGKPLIERIITQERVLGDGRYIDQGKVYHRQVALALGTTRDKYRWMPSAVAMVEYMRKPLKIGEAYSMTFPLNRHFWIEFPQPLVQTSLGEVGAFYLVHTSDLVTFMEAVRSFDPPRKALEEFKQTIKESKSETWVLVLLTPDGKMLWNCYYEKEEETAQWKVTDFHICPSGECRTSPGQEREGYWFYPCDACKEIVAYWTSWLATAYLMLNGAFQEQEEAADFAEVVEQTERKVPRSDKPHKFQEVKVEHRYKVIRFDACIKKTKPHREVQEPRGSWVEATKAINPDAIVYVDKHIGKTERLLRHERFTKKRGQRIKVRSYDKRIPMRLDEVRKRMIKVVATKFEPSKEGASDAKQQD